MLLLPKPVLLFIFSLLYAFSGNAQLTVKGRVLDKSKVNYVDGVRVISTGGALTFSDSLGRYSIRVSNDDSLFFVFNGKPTQKFPVKTITDVDKFDISLLIPVASKYTTLNEVVVYARTFKQDSLENRETYAKIFNFEKPKLSGSIAPTGGVGFDLQEIIRMFQFRRNKSMRKFRDRLEKQEQDRYIDYRFNKITVKRVINDLQSPGLDSFVVWYRPQYDFVADSSEQEFFQYIIDAYDQFKRLYPAYIKRED